MDSLVSQVLMLTSSTSFHTCPSIRMMYIPLNCAIVVELYTDSSILSRPAPHTQTQLYTSLALSLLSRYLNKTGHPLARYLPHSLEELRSETDIYQRMCTFWNVRILLLSLCKNISKVCRTVQSEASHSDYTIHRANVEPVGR